MRRYLLLFLLMSAATPGFAQERALVPLEVRPSPAFLEAVETGTRTPHQSDRPVRTRHGASASSTGMSMGSSTWPRRSRRALRKA